MSQKRKTGLLCKNKMHLSVLFSDTSAVISVKKEILPHPKEDCFPSPFACCFS